MYSVRYYGFLEYVEREFKTYHDAEQWCYQIGRKDIIPAIRRTA